jgi:hypothetical protein
VSPRAFRELGKGNRNIFQELIGHAA